MKKLIIFLTILFSFSVFAQNTIIRSTEFGDSLSQHRAEIEDVLTRFVADSTVSDTGKVSTTGTDIIYGVMTFNDTVHFTAQFDAAQVHPDINDSRAIGSSSKRWFIIYAKNAVIEQFWIDNEESNDSVGFVYDDSVLTIDKAVSFSGDVTLTEKISMDSASTFDVFNFTPHPYTIAVEDAGDTILTLTTSDLYSSIKLDLGGNVTPGISKLQIDTATECMILRFYNGDANQTIIFKDIVSGDDNLYMEGDFTLSQYDNIEFECVDATKAAQKWMELRRKNN